MKKIAAGEFKTRCLAVMDTVQKTKEPVLITKRGRPVAKLVPAEEDQREFLGRLEEVVKVVGDIESAIEPLDAWDALQ